MRWRAQNPRHTREYYIEPYTVQHFLDWAGGLARLLVWDVPRTLWDIGHHLVSKKYRIESARAYNRAMFANIPTEQIMVFDGEAMRPLRQEERTWPE